MHMVLRSRPHAAAMVGSNDTTTPANVTIAEASASVAFALPPSCSPPPSINDDDHQTDHDEMRCKRAGSTLSSGFYSVGVGAPRGAGATPGVSAARSPSLRFLEHLTMEISVPQGGSTSRTKKQFPMTVHHSKTKASWRHCHSYDDYRALQLRLLELMEQGHFCMAECPWLYTFLRRSFPKPPPLLSLGLLVGGADRSAEERRFALLRTVATLQSVLLNPDNHSCEVLTHGVATELVAFLYGETVEQVHCKASSAPSPVLVHPWEVSSPVGACALRGFSASLSDNEEDDGDVVMEEPPAEAASSCSSSQQDPAMCCSMCALQADHHPPHHHADEHVLAAWSKRRPSKLTITMRTSSSADTTMLSQFAETPTDPRSFPSTPRTPPSTPPPQIPENAILSPPRRYQVKEPQATAKRFSLGASTISLLHSLRQRVVSPGLSPYAA